MNRVSDLERRRTELFRQIAEIDEQIRRARQMAPWTPDPSIWPGFPNWPAQPVPTYPTPLPVWPSPATPVRPHMPVIPVPGPVPVGPAPSIAPEPIRLPQGF